MLQAEFTRLKCALEPLDSSRVIHLSATYALGGAFYDLVTIYPRFAGTGLRLLRAVPPRLRNLVISTALRGKGITEGEFLELPLQSLPELVVSEYTGNRCAGVIVGAPLGPVAYLSALMGAPFLTTNFLFSIRDAKDPDDYAHVERTAHRIMEKLRRRRRPLFQEYEFIFHYDPVHDRFLVRWITHLRLRLKRFPEAYMAFLKKHCPEKPFILLINCVYPWTQVEMGESVYLQVGGLGALSDEEFLYRYPVSGKHIVRPESEWGTPPEFVESTHRVGTKGDFSEIRVSAPAEFSNLCWRAFRTLQEMDESAIALDCFTYVNPMWVAQKGIAPFWLPFNTRDALSQARAALSGLHLQRAYLDLVPSFAEGTDTASYSEWQQVLSGVAREIVPIGVSPAHYPSDPYSVYMRSSRLRRLMRELPNRKIAPLRPPAFVAQIKALSKSFEG